MRTRKPPPEVYIVLLITRVQRVVATLLAAGGFARRAARLPGKRAGRGAPRAGRGGVGPAAGFCPEGVRGAPGQDPPPAAASAGRSRVSAAGAAPGKGPGPSAMTGGGVGAPGQ